MVKNFQRSEIIKKVLKAGIIVRKLYQKSVDMDVKLEENMYGWLGFFIFGPHAPITFLVKYPIPPGEWRYFS